MMEMNLEHLPIIDWDLGIKLAGNQKNLAEDLMAMLVKDLQSELTAINQLYADNNLVDLRKRVHKLHGGICYCGVPRLKTIISALDNDLKNNVTINLAMQMQQLNTEINNVLTNFSR
jgi:two-component system sensor histidine kinase BarA